MDAPPELVVRGDHQYCAVATADIAEHGRQLKVRLRGILENIIQEDRERRQHFLSLIRSNACVRRWVLSLARDLLQKELPQTEVCPPRLLYLGRL